MIDWMSVSQSEAATHPDMIELKAAFREHALTPAMGELLVRALTQAFLAGFGRGALLATQEAVNAYANAQVKKDKEGRWLRDARTGARDEGPSGMGER